MMLQGVESLAHGRILEQEDAGHDFLEVRVVLTQKSLHRFIMVKEIVQFFKQGPIGDGSGKKKRQPACSLESSEVRI